MTDPSADDVVAGLIGTTIAGRYEIRSIVGVGGMGAVVRARHLGLDRDVALKVLLPEMAGVEDIEERFVREARSVAQLQHPNIIAVSDFGSAPDGMQFLVMELLEGESLGARVGVPFEPAHAVALALQILRGLEHAHAKGIVHRDLKPENAFLTRDHDGNEVLKLLDFGLAKALGHGLDQPAKPSLTRSGIAVGTPRYMSPEQVLAHDVDARADLYGVGILLYEMLAGVVPFDSEDLVEVLGMQLQAEPPPLGEQVPPDIQAVVAKLLAKKRDERYSSATEAIVALERCGSGSTHTPAPPARAPLPPIAPPPPPPLPDPTIDAVEVVEPEPPRRADKPRAAKKPRAPKPPRRPLVRTPLIAASLLAAVLVGWVFWPTGNAGRRLDALADRAATVLWKAAPRTETSPRDRESAAALWEQGRAAAQDGPSRLALARYSAAIALDPSMLNESTFRTEFDTLLREPALREQAIAIAMGPMGREGHPFLLELVNTTALASTLTYERRHEILAELERDASAAAQIDAQNTLVLDLTQANASREPCANLLRTLDGIDHAPAPIFGPHLQRVEMPTASDPGCGGLADKLLQVRMKIEQRGPR